MIEDKRDLQIQNNRGKSFTVIGAIDGQEGIRHYKIIQSTNNSDHFTEFLRELMQRVGGSKCTLVMDNLSVHHSKKVRSIMKENPSFETLYLPAYSCTLNPIETLWSVVKKNWR
jgi:transposase